MIDDVKDLSRAEKEKALSRKKFFRYLSRTFIAMVISTIAVALFALYIVNDFLAAFTSAHALKTTGLFVATLFLFMMLQIGTYKYTVKNGSSIRDFWLTTIMTVITFIASMAACTLFSNVFAMPIALATLVLIELIDRRTATLSTAVVGVLMLIFFMFNDSPKDFNIALVVSAIVCNGFAAVLINFLEYKH